MGLSHLALPEDEYGPEWAPRWSDDQLLIALRLQELNDRGLPSMERLNILMDTAFDNSTVDAPIQPFLYPVWDIEDIEDGDLSKVHYDGIAVACPEWLTEEGAEAQRAYFDDEVAADGWAVDWHGLGVREFPYVRSNSVLGLLYQRELDAGEGRVYRPHFHVVRRSEHEARRPVGLLITTAAGDDLTHDVLEVMFQHLMEAVR